ncbi:MAG: ABC transporter ATP-binding protein, partial [Lachnospiraceae bacterium]|nr:ABC transporter ATP-binding protein [Lachnospiraceae bacterium]
MEDIALSVENLDIVYMPYHSMRIRNLLGRTDTRLKPICAIRDMSFSVQKGEIVGIVGKNGSGKTTLLRAIAGIFSPDRGEIKLYGNRVSLMALGVGFDQELSGRENIVLSGMMLGFSRKEIREQTDAIIAFSELGDFIDYPVRTYSSGMYSKLAFSITSFLETDIMLIDEVLSVGDIAFQDKSRKKMRELIAQRKHTVLLVSHNVGLLQDVCDRVLWMDEGKLCQFGGTETVLKEYSDFMLKSRGSEENSGVSDKSVKKHTWLYGHWEQAWEKVSEIIPDLEGRLDGFLNQWMNKEFAEQADKQIVAVGQDFEYISRQLKDMYNLG